MLEGERQLIRKLRKQGVTLAEIERRVGWSTFTIRKITADINENGHRRRRKFSDKDLDDYIAGERVKVICARCNAEHGSLFRALNDRRPGWKEKRKCKSSC